MLPGLTENLGGVTPIVHLPPRSTGAASTDLTVRWFESMRDAEGGDMALTDRPGLPGRESGWGTLRLNIQ